MKLKPFAAALIRVLHDDDHILAVDKPPGVELGDADRGGGRGLLAILRTAARGGPTLRAVNRLARDESGVLLLAKDAETAGHIRADIKAGRVTLEYAAVVRGRMKRPALRIESDAGTSRGQRPVRSRRTSKTRARSATPLPTSVVRRQGGDHDRTLVACRTVVPTTHALRAQLRSVSLPVVGDKQWRRGGAPARPPRRHTSGGPPRYEPTYLHLTTVAFRDPRTGRRRSIATPPPDAFDEAVADLRPVRRAMGAALGRRLAYLADADTNAYRLLTRDVEGVPGLTVERYADVAVLQVFDARRPDDKTPVRTTRSWSTRALRSAARWYRSTLGLRAVYVTRMGEAPVSQTTGRRTGHGAPDAIRRDTHHGDRAGGHTRAGQAPENNRVDRDADGDDGAGGRRAPDRGPRAQRAGAAPADNDPLLGPPASGPIEIMERGLRFAIQPWRGQSVGLFLDQRDNRHRVRNMAAGKDVLNLFAFTCGYSVAAAAGGARRTVSVDIAPAYLAWGRDNFALNHLDTGPHEFIRAAAADYLKRAARRGTTFDIIILDPPSFAHGRRRGESFELKRDLQALLTSAVAVLRPRGVVVVSTSHRGLPMRWLREQVAAAAGGRHHRVTASPALPPDFAMDRDHSKTLFVRFA